MLRVALVTILLVLLVHVSCRNSAKPQKDVDTTTTTASAMQQYRSGWHKTSYYRSYGCTGGLTRISMTALGVCDSTPSARMNSSSSNYMCKSDSHIVSLFSNAYADRSCSNAQLDTSSNRSKAYKIKQAPTACNKNTYSRASCSTNGAAESAIKGITTTYFYSSSCDASTAAAKDVFPLNACVRLSDDANLYKSMMITSCSSTVAQSTGFLYMDANCQTTGDPISQSIALPSRLFGKDTCGGAPSPYVSTATTHGKSSSLFSSLMYYKSECVTLAPTRAPTLPPS